MIRRSFQLSAFLLAISICTACNGGGSPPPFYGPSPLPSPQVQHLYIPNDNAGGTVLVFTLPLTNTSVASATSAGLPQGGTSAAASGVTNLLAVGDITGHVMTFTLPLTNGENPSATFPNTVSSNNGQLNWSAAGALYDPTFAAPVEIFSSPFSNASTPSGNVPSSLSSSDGTAFDTSGNLYITDAGASQIAVWNGATVAVTSVTPAVNGLRGAATNGAQLFVAKVSAPVGILVFTLPLGASATPAFTITNGLNAPEGVAFDAQGNLYIADLGTGNINVFTPPFSASSAPSVVLHIAGAALFNIGIGK